jgi:hypothetical protein
VSKVAVNTTEVAVSNAAQKKSRPRSPNYPGISLEEAVKRARQLYQQEQRNYTNVEVIIGHWGFKPRSGAGMVELAALVKYGFLVAEGSGTGRRAKLTDEVVSILLDSEGSPRRAELLKRAALRPPVHAQLWKEYNGSLPSPASLRHDLIVKKNFTESGANEFIGEFRATVTYAKLAPTDKLTDDGQDKGGATSATDTGLQPGGFATSLEEPTMNMPVVSRTTAGVAGQSKTVTERVLQLPLSGESWAMLQVPVPMTESDWEQMLAVLAAMKPGIVKANAVGTSSDS